MTYNTTIIILTLALLCLSSASSLSQPTDNPCNMGRGNPDPRNEKVVCLPVIGRMEGRLECVRGGEQYGRNIYAVGDVNHDGLQGWIVGHIRCDSVMTIHDLRPTLLPTTHGPRPLHALAS